MVVAGALLCLAALAAASGESSGQCIEPTCVLRLPKGCKNKVGTCKFIPCIGETDCVNGDCLCKDGGCASGPWLCDTKPRECQKQVGTCEHSSSLCGADADCKDGLCLCSGDSCTVDGKTCSDPGEFAPEHADLPDGPLPPYAVDDDGMAADTRAGSGAALAFLVLAASASFAALTRFAVQLRQQRCHRVDADVRGPLLEQ